MPATRSKGRSTRGPVSVSLRKAWLAAGYSLTSWITPASSSAASSRAGGTAKRRVAATVAGHDRAGTGQRFVELAGKLTVVDGRGGVTIAGAEQREATAHAEPNDADLAGAVARTNQVIPGGADVGECAPVPTDHGGHGGNQAACGATRAEQVDGQGEVAETGEPVGVAAHDVVEAEDLVDHHHGRPWTDARWAGQVAAK